MVAFDPSADLSGDPAYRYMHNSFVTLFWRMPLLDNAIGQLRHAGYDVVVIDAHGWRTPELMHEDLARTLDFPSYYGRNLDAFNDCLRDLVARGFERSEKAAGLVLVFTGYDRFAKPHGKQAHAVLDIIATQARSALLFGERVFCLVQSDDPVIEFDPVGATPVIWNDAEWLDANRR